MTPLDDSPLPRTPPWPAGPLPDPVDAGRVLALIDEHGRDLLAIARLVSGSVPVSRAIVADVVIAAATPQGERYAVPPVASRASLAETVLLACRATRPLDVRGWPESPALAWMAAASSAQRAVVALFLHGEHTPRQISQTLGLPSRAVCRLLVAALDDLSRGRVGYMQPQRCGA